MSKLAGPCHPTLNSALSSRAGRWPAPAGSVRDHDAGQPSPVGQTPPTTRRVPRPRTCPGRGFAAPPRRARRWLAEVVRYANEPDPSRTCRPRCPRAPPDAAVGVPLQALDPDCSREGTMPRSFLVKTHSSHRVPNYGKLETQRGRGWPDLRPQHAALRGWRQLGSPWELGHTCPR